MGRRSTWKAAYRQEYNRLLSSGLDLDAITVRAAMAAEAAEEARLAHRRAWNREYQRRRRAREWFKTRQFESVTILVTLPRSALALLDREAREVYRDCTLEEGRSEVITTTLTALLEQKHRPYTDEQATEMISALHFDP